MKVLQKPTSLVLVGVLFISISSGLALADRNSDVFGQVNKPDAISSGFVQSERNADLGQLKVGEDTIYYPWASRQIMGMRLPLSSAMTELQAKKEEITMDKSHPSAVVKDLSAINSVKERDLLYEDSQNGGPEDQLLINSLDVDVLGTGKRSGDSVPMMNTGIDGIGGDAKNSPELSNPDRSSFDHGFEDYDPKKVGNYLNIDVSGISVSAINTMEGGNAVATSNIIIKPVQIIYCTPEVEEKLR